MWNPKSWRFVGIFLLLQPIMHAQTVVDEVVAVVGSQVILRSEVETRAFQMEADERGNRTRKVDRCEVLEDMVIQKMLVMQGELDSVEVTDEMVEDELQRRIAQTAAQVGGEKRLEQMMGKTVDQLKEDSRPNIYEQLMVERMQMDITGSVRVTPSEVEAFFRSMPSDSLPPVPGEVELAQVALIPEIREEEKERVKQELMDIRKDLLSGSNFCIKAKFYSQDPGSAENCGELGYVKREDLVPEFSAVAFGLEVGQISEPVETQYGFHIIEKLGQRGQYASFRHILIKPEVALDDLIAAEEKLNTLLVKYDTLEFKTLAFRFSQDESSSANGGKLTNPRTGGTRFMMEELDPPTLRLIQGLSEGQISDPQIATNQTGDKMVRVIKVVKKIEPHVANLRQDYNKIQQAALSEKKVKVLREWVSRREDDLYLNLTGYLEQCPALKKWHQAP